MTTTNAPVEAASDWADETADEYSSLSHFAGDVAWKLLTHSRADAPDLARVMHLPRPDGLDAEDMQLVMWQAITGAGRIGYLAGKIDVAGFTVPRWGEDGRITTEQVARAIAAMLSIPLVDDTPDRRGGLRARIVAAKEARTAADK
jgi:hypothetical protein